MWTGSNQVIQFSYQWQAAADLIASKPRQPEAQVGIRKGKLRSKRVGSPLG